MPTVTDAFLHDLPPLPMDENRSKVKAAQLPISFGNARTTDGVTAWIGAVTWID
jgi:hypothetical protein